MNGQFLVELFYAIEFFPVIKVALVAYDGCAQLCRCARGCEVQAGAGMPADKYGIWPIQGREAGKLPGAAQGQADLRGILRWLWQGHAALHGLRHKVGGIVTSRTAGADTH